MTYKSTSSGRYYDRFVESLKKKTNTGGDRPTKPTEPGLRVANSETTPNDHPTEPTKLAWVRPAELPYWPTAWRERWGVRANDLEASGLSWSDAESRAFDEVKAEMSAPPPPVEPAPQAGEKVSSGTTKAIQCFTGFLFGRPEPKHKIDEMADREGLSPSDIENAASVMGINRFTRDGTEWWGLR